MESDGADEGTSDRSYQLLQKPTHKSHVPAVERMMLKVRVRREMLPEGNNGMQKLDAISFPFRLFASWDICETANNDPPSGASTALTGKCTGHALSESGQALLLEKTR